MRFLFFFITFIFLSMNIYANVDYINSTFLRKYRALEKQFNSEVKRLKTESIRQYEKKKRLKMNANKLNDAIILKNIISRLKSKNFLRVFVSDNSLDFYKQAQKGFSKESPSYSQGDLSTRQLKKMLKKRYIKFFSALADNSLAIAIKYLDPKILKVAGSEKAKEYLRVYVMFLNAAKIIPKDIGVKKIILGENLKSAKLIGRFKVLGVWQNSEPEYWIFTEGQWYTADKDQLVNFVPYKK